MDKQRFSLNTTHIADPIAESTCLNILGSSSSMHFQWGDTPISPKNRSHSSICLTDIKTSLHNNTNASSCDRVNASRMNLNRIDQRVYADIQSKGLASRIVNYHEKGELINRSMSVNKLYGSSEKFPVVHLKKAELPCKAKQSNLSMTRIPPPEKSMFYGNTLSSILRSNSVVMHKSDEELSCENRPILHPPTDDNEIAPTRSVLDVLKEISRKRINSDEINHNESIKKYCNRERNGPSDVASTNTNLQQNNKRQREMISNQQNSLSKKHNFVPDHHSPEQLAKKRLCSYNNDITSSLSSSKIYTNKRKIYEQKSASETLSSTLSNDDYTHSMPKKVETSHKQESGIGQSPTGNQNHKVEEQLKTAAPSTILPSKEILNSSTPHRTTSEKLYPACQEVGVSSQKQKITLFNTKYTDSKSNNNDSENSLDKENGEFSGIAFVKPKKKISSGTKNPMLERTQTSKLALMLSGLRGELYDNEDQINPSKTAAEQQQVTNVEQTKTKTITPDPQNKLSLTPISSTTTNPSNILSSVTTTKSETVPTISNASTTTPKSSSSSTGFNSIATGTSAKTSNEMIKLPSPIKAEKPTEPPKQLSLSETKMTSSLTNSGLNKNNPALGGFSFKPPTTQSTQPNSLLGNSTSNGGFTFGNASTVAPPASTQQPITTNSNNVPAFSFGSSTITPLSTASSVESATKNDPKVAPTFGSATMTPFSFSAGPPSLAPSKSVEQALSTSNKPIDSTSGFKNTAISTSFVGGSIAPSPTIQTLTQNSNSNLSFGGASVITTTPNPTPSVNFQFGAANVVVDKNSVGFGATKNMNQMFNPSSSKVETPAINTNFGAAQLPGQKSGGFSFSTSTTSAELPRQKSGGFSFSTSTSAASSNQSGANVFGGSLPNSGAKPSFSFGDNSSSKNSLAPNLQFKSTVSTSPDYSSQGSSDAKQTKPFTFGPTTTNATTTKSSDAFSFNSQKSAEVSKAFSFGNSNFASSNPAAPSNTIQPFSFGSSAKPTEALNNQNKTFSFGANNMPSESNLFGNPVTTSSTTTAAKGPFSFTSDNNSIGKSAVPAPNENLFAPPQPQNQMAGFSDRPIRRATRRLQKS